MSFLLDSDICSVHLRNPDRLFNRFLQHGGQLNISSITLSDLVTLAFKQDDPNKILTKVQVFLEDVNVLPFDDQSAFELGRLRGSLLRKAWSSARWIS
jgi:tRNA(fMet)-specific endonuclease VapC